MKTLYFILFLLFCKNSFGQISQSDNYILKEKYTTKGKQIISYNKAGLKDGVSKYYNNVGYQDSAVTYKNGKRNGLKTFYYAANDIMLFEYKNNRIIRQVILDSNQNVKYESPLNINKIGKTTFEFASGRSFYRMNTTDTIYFHNKDVPSMNLNIYFPGATVIRLNNTTYIIRKWDAQLNTNKGKIVVGIYDRMFTHPFILRNDIFLIDIK